MKFQCVRDLPGVGRNGEFGVEALTAGGAELLPQRRVVAQADERVPQSVASPSGTSNPAGPMMSGMPPLSEATIGNPIARPSTSVDADCSFQRAVVRDGTARQSSAA